MRGLLLLEFLSMYKALRITIPMITIPSVILCLSIFLPFDQRIFIFSSVFSMQLVSLVSPSLLSEILRGGWRPLYQAGILHEPLKVISVIIFSSIIITFPLVAIFMSLYIILLYDLFSPGVFTSLISICLLSYSIGSFFKTILDDKIYALILCILYNIILLPFTLPILLYPDQNSSGMVWSLLKLMNSVVNPAGGHLNFESIFITNIEWFLTYFLLVSVSSWVLCKRIKL